MQSDYKQFDTKFWTFLGEYLACVPKIGVIFEKNGVTSHLLANNSWATVDMKQRSTYQQARILHVDQ